MRCWVVYSSWAALTFPHRDLVNRIVSIFSSCLRRFGVSGHTLGCDAVFGLIVSDKTGGKARPAPRRRESNTWTVTDPKYNFIVLCALKTTTKVLTERQQNPRWAKNCVKAGRGGGGGDGEMITGWGAHKYSVFYSLLLLLHRCCLEPTLYSLYNGYIITKTAMFFCFSPRLLGFRQLKFVLQKRTVVVLLCILSSVNNQCVCPLFILQDKNI